MEEVIAKINAKGFQINNLFQIASDFWRCNIRDNGGGFFAFANAPSAKEALLEALKRAEEGPVNKPSKGDFSDILG